MPLKREKDGTWTLHIASEEEEKRVGSENPILWEAAPRYMTILDRAFTKAKEKCESEFIFCLLRMKGHDVGWDPFETTLRGIPEIVDIAKNTTGEALNHLFLWIYGHILEASEPYELIANLLDVANNETYRTCKFHNKNKTKKNPIGTPMTPGEKIAILKSMSKKVGLNDIVLPLEECWNRNLRNAIFHADYSFHKDGISILKPEQRTYPKETVLTLVNRTLAYHYALTSLYEIHISSYKEPEVLMPHIERLDHPDFRFKTIIREGVGIVGLKDNWTEEDFKKGPQHLENGGRVTCCIGKISLKEYELLQSNPYIKVLPPIQNVNL